MLICNGKILTMAGDEIENGFIQIEGKTITKIGEMKGVKNYKKLIESCWAEKPEERPTFDEILEKLKTDKNFKKNC